MNGDMTGKWNISMVIRDTDIIYIDANEILRFPSKIKNGISPSLSPNTPKLYILRHCFNVVFIYYPAEKITLIYRRLYFELSELDLQLVSKLNR